MTTDRDAYEQVDYLGILLRESSQGSPHKRTATPWEAMVGHVITGTHSADELDRRARGALDDWWAKCEKAYDYWAEVLDRTYAEAIRREEALDDRPQA